ncbi:hypothetical protein Hanom_Chr15g01366851 [Helianthus anomalus]
MKFMESKNASEEQTLAVMFKFLFSKLFSTSENVKTRTDITVTKLSPPIDIVYGLNGTTIFIVVINVVSIC